MSTPADFNTSNDMQEPTPLNRMREAVHTINVTFKPRYLGLGFVWAWVYCAFQTPVLFPGREGVSINADTSWLASALTVVITLFVFGFLWRRSNLRNFTSLHWTAGILVAAGTILSMLCSVYFPTLTFVSVLSGVLSGIGTAWLCIFWVDAMTQLDIEHIEIMVPSAFGITLLCSLVVPAIQGFVGVLVIAALPVISSLLLRSVYNDSNSQHATHGKPASLDFAPSSAMTHLTHSENTRYLPQSIRSTLTRAGITLGIFYAAIGFMDGLSALNWEHISQFSLDLAAFIGSLCGLLMALGFVLYTIRVDFQSLFRWLTPLMVLMLALTPWTFPLANVLPEVIGVIADTVMQVIVYVYIISLTRRRVIPAALGIGIVQGFVQLGVLIGNIAGAQAAYYVAQNTISIFAVVLTLICVVVFATLLVPQRAQVTTPAEVGEGANSDENPCTLAPLPATKLMSTQIGEDTVALSQSVLEADVKSAYSSAPSRCEELTQRYDLSRREAEILEYLAKGRSQPYIREELMLSKNTVATHVKHIYQKLNVHSKQELIDLVEGEK